MTAKTVFGSILAGLSLLIAVRAQNPTVQATASVVGAGLMGYSTTTLLLTRSRQQKNRVADAEAYLEFLRQINRERLAETPTVPAACQGCCHYHGQTYGGNLLVCAMHPHGVETDSCPDWQVLP
ncbi:MAG: hypothetical protein KME07_18175 [Pegethrix bostrychoides GSE-TBD4-15B]|jgi:hypothetical protein|uniref:Uncharacterized protein n=1 Tax=Pegethrix bostrychoides GSE-TBD4-15B TaxID=2839662 RepID=A0A951U7C2_9CYAN|nr:hypothetical protein [Pegethrix bostrychoides GSE-TBD4-15B]